VTISRRTQGPTLQARPSQTCLLQAGKLRRYRTRCVRVRRYGTFPECDGLLTLFSPLSTLFTVNYRERITIEPGQRGGKPCIRGLRITVQDVLEYLASGMTVEEILGDFPDLTREDIQACLAFAADRERKLTSIPSG